MNIHVYMLNCCEKNMLVGRKAESGPIDKGTGLNGPKGAELKVAPINLEI